MVVKSNNTYHKEFAARNFDA